MHVLTLSIYSPIILLRCSFFNLPTVEFSVRRSRTSKGTKKLFSNLVLPHDHKFLLQSLVQAHHNEIGFDDFINTSRVKDTISSLTFLVSLVLVSDLHIIIKRQIFLVELISFFFFVFKGKLSRPKLRVILFVDLL